MESLDTPRKGQKLGKRAREIIVQLNGSNNLSSIPYGDGSAPCLKRVSPSDVQLYSFDRSGWRLGVVTIPPLPRSVRKRNPRFN